MMDSLTLMATNNGGQVILHLKLMISTKQEKLQAIYLHHHNLWLLKYSIKIFHKINFYQILFSKINLQI